MSLSKQQQLFLSCSWCMSFCFLQLRVNTYQLITDNTTVVLKTGYCPLWTPVKFEKKIIQFWSVTSSCFSKVLMGLKKTNSDNWPIWIITDHFWSNSMQKRPFNWNRCDKMIGPLGIGWQFNYIIRFNYIRLKSQVPMLTIILYFLSYHND